MHKRVGITFLVGVLLVLFLVPGAGDKFFALFFIGLVPYTSYTIPSVYMFALYSVLLAIGTYAATKQLTTALSIEKRELASREMARKKVLHSTSNKRSGAKEHRLKKHYLPAVES